MFLKDIIDTLDNLRIMCNGHNILITDETKNHVFPCRHVRIWGKGPEYGAELILSGKERSEEDYQKIVEIVSGGKGMIPTEYPGLVLNNPDGLVNIDIKNIRVKEFEFDDADNGYVQTMRLVIGRPIIDLIIPKRNIDIKYE